MSTTIQFQRSFMTPQRHVEPMQSPSSLLQATMNPLCFSMDLLILCIPWEWPCVSGFFHLTQCFQGFIRKQVSPLPFFFFYHCIHCRVEGWSPGARGEVGITCTVQKEWARDRARCRAEGWFYLDSDSNTVVWNI